MAFIIEAKKDLPVDMGENFPYLGSYDRKVRRHPRFCRVGLPCPDQPVGYEEGSLRDLSFKEICTVFWIMTGMLISNFSLLHLNELERSPAKFRNYYQWKMKNIN